MLIVTAIFGIDPRQTLALQVAAVVFALLFIAWLYTLRWRPDITVRRELPDLVTDGQKACYFIEIHNHGERVERNLVLREVLRTQYPTIAEFRTHRDLPIGVNWFDRRIGFPKWLQMVRQRRGAQITAVDLPAIPPSAKIRVEVPMLPLRRGTIHFESIELLCPDPLGLCCARSGERNVAHLTSLPERHPVPKLSWPSERKFHRGGLALTVAVGDSQEFFGLREYRPGDPIKRIHWRSFAKLGVPLIREFQDEYFDRHALIVDTYTGTGDPASFESVVSAAASFVDAGHPSDSLLDLVFVGERVWRLTAGRGLASTRQVLCDLADVEASSTDEFAALAEYLRGYRKQLATVILVSAFWNNLREAFMREFQHLDTRAFAVIVGTQPNSETTTDGSSSRCWVRPDHLAADLAKVNFGRAVT